MRVRCACVFMTARAVHVATVIPLMPRFAHEQVIMCTNRIDILDPALLRPGRIDRKIEFPNPTEAVRRRGARARVCVCARALTHARSNSHPLTQARESILRIHSRKMNLMRGINLSRIASKMSSCSGAECKAVCTEAGMFALRERRVHVTQEDLEMAVAKVMKKDAEKDMSVLKLFK